MKALLKKIQGGLALASVYGLIGTAVLGIGGGLGVVAGYFFKDDDFKEFYESDKVQEIVMDTVAEKSAELEERLANGEITQKEYDRELHRLNDDSNKSGIAEKIAAEVFADDEEYQGLVKRQDQLKMAGLSLISIGGFSMILTVVEHFTDFAENMGDKGHDLLNEGKYLAYIESKEKEEKLKSKIKAKKEKKFQKELKGYSEEIQEMS